MKITLTKEQIFNYYGFQSYLDNPQVGQTKTITFECEF